MIAPAFNISLLTVGAAALALLIVIVFVAVKLMRCKRRIQALRTSSTMLQGSAAPVALRVNLVQVSINDHKAIFEDVIIALQAAFKDLGIPCIRTENEFVDGAINVVIGSVMFVSEQVAAALKGKPYVLYQMEQLAADRGHLPNFPGYVGLMRDALCVWDYSLSNIEQLAQMGITRVAHVPAGFHSALEVLAHDQPKDIEVLFYGALTPRREHIIRALRDRGVSAEALFGMYGDARNSIIARAKILLNLHAVEIDTLEEIRLSYLLANRCFVISELSDHNPYGDGVVFRPYDQLVETCVHYLQAGDEVRQEIANCGYQAIRKLDYTEFVRKAVQKLAM